MECFACFVRPRQSKPSVTVADDPIACHHSGDQIFPYSSEKSNQGSVQIRPTKYVDVSDLVQIFNLVSNPQLNGTNGIVVGFNDQDQVLVKTENKMIVPLNAYNVRKISTGGNTTQFEIEPSGCRLLSKMIPSGSSETSMTECEARFGKSITDLILKVISESQNESLADSIAFFLSVSCVLSAVTFWNRS